MKKKNTLTTPLMLSGLLVGSAFTLSGCVSSSSSSGDDATGPQHDSQGVFAAGAPLNNEQELDDVIAAANRAVGEDGVEQFLDELEGAIFVKSVDVAGASTTDDADRTTAARDRLRERAGRWRQEDAPDRVIAATVQQDDCPNGGHIVITSDSTENDRYERWDTTVAFHGCAVNTPSWGDVVVNGQLDETWEESWGDENFENYSVHFDITGSAAGGDLVLSGEEHWGIRARSGDVFFSEQVRIPRLEFLAGEHYIGFLDVDLNYVEREVEEQGTTRYPYEDHWSGRIGTSGMQGHIALDTPKTVAGPNYDACPTEGELTISGNGTASVLFGMDTGISNAEVALVINNALSQTWDDCDDFFDEFDLLEGIFHGGL
ncbi:hypothetical protein ACN2MM_12285 [Alkalilimnicola ehrlichii MLHE-1]|uniref:Lipoprotein n=1 Tax=Alkalilimnicola ehrlichii (strain ATCC BAA-1101 / DSM 17681 / MLHE-1) TaxID=187272 RepID=Q0A693_ALKEH|nr:hypothetical protein [Alkalilimnicola ehrlichii]ABI57644.1 hypothetical protein Mlg_2302 [Alkalilimnicola ehrlichii MLHE-1]